MRLRILPKAEVLRTVESMMADYRVVGPRAKGPEFTFEPLTEPGQVRLDYRTTILPPKVALLPPHERLVAFNLEGEAPAAQAVLEAEPTVLLGVHTCDLHAMKLLDLAFSDEYPDAHYLERRKQTLIVSMECLQPCDEHAFCRDMGTFMTEGGYDLHLADIGEVYAVHVGTEAGAALLERYAQTRNPDDAQVRRLNEALSSKWGAFKHRLQFPASELPDMLGLAYRHPLWAELGERCLACGSCTNVCPTCYCFNVVDSIDLTMTDATRTRRWASCQLDEFALVAGGENFRESRADRQRHRFYRKGKWIQERFGVLGCVGCGRCVRTCLVHIDIAEGFNAIHASA
jgi:sulfhydrogenase subunit beta (sulfur reductase)